MKTIKIDNKLNNTHKYYLYKYHMGIRGLNSLLDKFDCIRNFKKIPRNINVIAIDANLYLCKYLLVL